MEFTAGLNNNFSIVMSFRRRRNHIKWVTDVISPFDWNEKSTPFWTRFALGIAMEILPKSLRGTKQSSGDCNEKPDIVANQNFNFKINVVQQGNAQIKNPLIHWRTNGFWRFWNKFRMTNGIIIYSFLRNICKITEWFRFLLSN